MRTTKTKQWISYHSLIIILACFFVVQLAIGNEVTTGNVFTINGEIKGIDKDIWVQIKSKGSDKILDSVMTQKGKFVFKGRANNPSLHILTFLRNKIEKDSQFPFQPSFELFLESSSIQLIVDLAQLPNSYPEFYQIPLAYKTVIVKGSKSHEQYMIFKNNQYKLDKKRSDLFDEYISYLNPPEGKKGTVSEGVSIVKKIDVASKKVKESISTYINKNEDNFVGLMVAKNRLKNYDANEIEDIIQNFSPKIKESDIYKEFLDLAEGTKKSASGSKFIDFELKDHLGNSVKLSDHVGKEKYVLLEFWASWCSPCRADISHLKEVYKIYNPAGFEVISISMDHQKEKWLKAIDEELMPWLQLSDLKAFKGELSKLYNFRGIPTCVLIDPSGNIVTRNMRGSWMDYRLIEMYGNKFSEKQH